MVGEIRDTETAQIAIQSALTGHLVFTTVHANNVVDVIARFLNMGVSLTICFSVNCILASGWCALLRILLSPCVHYPPEMLAGQRPLSEAVVGDVIFTKAGLH